jgi:uncharacterized protein YqgV (UPF0045/DUF77 family)
MISPTLKYPLVTGIDRLNAMVAAATKAVNTAELAITLELNLPLFEG